MKIKKENCYEMIFELYEAEQRGVFIIDVEANDFILERQEFFLNEQVQLIFSKTGVICLVVDDGCLLFDIRKISPFLLELFYKGVVKFVINIINDGEIICSVEAQNK